MRILFCAPTMEGGGAERQLAYLARAIVDRRHEVHVCLAKREGPNLERLESSGAIIHSTPQTRNRSFARVFSLLHLILRIKPDLVQTWLPMMDIQAGLAALASRTPWIMTERNTPQESNRTWLDRIRKRLAAKASLIVANSNSGSDYWLSAAPGVPNTVIRNGLLLNGSRPRIPSKSLLGDRPYLLATGRLTPQKDFRTLLHSLAKWDDGQRPQLFICGHGELEKELTKDIVRLQLSNNVHLLGFRDDIGELMRGARAFVSTSLWEGMPNVVMEAQSMGVACILSDIPAHREIADTSTATFFAPGDADELAVRMREIWENEKVRESIGEAGGYVAQKWDIRRIAEEWEAAYLGVLTKRLLPQESTT